MTLISTSTTRRRAIQWCAAAGSSLFLQRGLFAELLTATPMMTEGPFYPDKMPLDTDNDLLIINDATTPAVGEITYLTGNVRDRSGDPIANSFVEIWQVDSTASYLHTRGRNRNGNDAGFQGYGRFLTDSMGRYYFRTIKPVPYPGRTPHIHVAVSRNGRRLLTSQIFIKGHPQNDNDGVLRGVREAAARESVMVDFKPLAGSVIGEHEAKFEIILGQTAVEDERGTLRGVAPSRQGRS
jgi:protocatechuate 3,4-dioxygenase beta subunit